MKKSIHKILFISTIVIMGLLSVQTATRFIHLKALYGVFVPAEMPAFTFSSYKDGTFQEGFENYGRDHFAFREWLIPLYNQFEWDLFKKVERKDIFFGRDDYLYFYEMLQDRYESLTFKYANNGEEMTQILEKDAKMVYYLQEVLKEYGTTLLVCIAPGKDKIYPEYLPENNMFYRQGGVHAEEFYAKRFRELGVNCLDLNSIFKSLKGNVDYPLFYKASSHYSTIAATYAADTLLRYMEQISGLNLLNFKFKEKEIKKTKEIDKDLENQFNLIRPFVKEDYYYVDIEPIPDSTAVKTRWLTIGDSFYWSLSEKMQNAYIFESTPFWYYGKEVHFDWGSDYFAQNHNLLSELIEADFVMLLWCPINIYNLDHNGFVSKSLLSLCSSDIYNNVIANIHSNPEWYNAVVENAQKKGIPVDEQIQLEADWVIEQNIKDYFNLNEVQVPSQRNEKIVHLCDLFKGKSPKEISEIKHNYRVLKLSNANCYNETLMNEAIKLSNTAAN